MIIEHDYLASESYAPEPAPVTAPHPLRTIRDIRTSFEGDEVQLNHFDDQLVVTDIDELPELLHRWATLGHDGFKEFLLSKPFLGLEFGARSYDESEASD